MGPKIKKEPRLSGLFQQISNSKLLARNRRRGHFDHLFNRLLALLLC